MEKRTGKGGRNAKAKRAQKELHVPGLPARPAQGQAPPSPLNATWVYPYLEACELLGDEPAETGDVLGLDFRGPLRKPELAAPGVGEPCIVIAVARDRDRLPRHVEVTLLR
jgi:hypothetical protein